MALLETLQDNFNDNSIDTGKWAPDFFYGGTVQETSQQIKITLPAASGNGPFAYMDSLNSYSIAGSYTKVELISISGQVDQTVLSVYSNPQNYEADFIIQSGTVYIRRYSYPPVSDLVLTTFPYSPIQHRWLRIRESSGTFYWDTSPDGIVWTNHASIAHSVSTLGWKTYFQAASFYGVSNGGYAIFDNFNIEYYTPSISLTGSATLTTDFYINFSASIAFGGSGSIDAIGTSLADQRQIDKTYLYKVYDSSGTYLGLWNDVISDLNYDHELNTPGSSIQVELARNSDSRVVALEQLLTTTGENITTQDSNNLIVGAESRNSVGPGSNVDVNYYVQIFVFYGEITELSTSSGEIITTEADEPIQVNYGAVNGLRKFHGKIVRYVSRYGGQETVQVSIDSLGRELDNDVLENGTNTSVEYAGYDPSNIVKDALDKFTAGGGIVDYDTSSVATTGTNVTYTFRVNTILEVIQKCLELAPYDWYWYVGLGDDILYFQDKPTAVSHTFILGKHIQELNLEYSIENLVNLVYFTGGETAGVNLFKKYSDATSISNYGQGLQRISDHRVTIDANAALIAEAEIDRNSIPRYRTSITILDTVFDIEDIRLGQLIAFRNFDNYIDELELQIVGLRYEPDRVTLQLDSLLPSVNKRIEDLRRNLVELDNVETPDAPT